MISALLDNYLYQNQAKGFGLKEILWRRVLDVNDRSLRSIVVGLGPKSNGITQESRFRYYSCFGDYGNSLPFQRCE